MSDYPQDPDEEYFRKDMMEHKEWCPQHPDFLRYITERSPFGIIDLGRGECECMNKEEQKHAFLSGATSSEHLPGYDMIAEVFLTRVARRLDLGEKKHGKWNYRKGIRDKAFIIDRLNHAFLHLTRAMDQINFDKPVMDDDLAAVAVNVQMAMEYQDATNND